MRTNRQAAGWFMAAVLLPTLGTAGFGEGGAASAGGPGEELVERASRQVLIWRATEDQQGNLHFDSEVQNAPVVEAAPQGSLADLFTPIPPLPPDSPQSVYRQVPSPRMTEAYRAAVQQAVADSLAKLFPVSGQMAVGLKISESDPRWFGTAFWDNDGWGYGALFKLYEEKPIDLRYVFVTPLDQDKNKIPRTPAQLVKAVNRLSRLHIEDATTEEVPGGGIKPLRRPVKSFASEGSSGRITVTHEAALATDGSGKNIKYFPPEVGAVMFVLLNDVDLRHFSAPARAEHAARADRTSLVIDQRAGAR